MLKSILKSLVCLTVVASLLLIGCIFSNNGFGTVEVNKEHYHFSFEYSTYYKKNGPKTIDPDWDIPGVSIGLLAPKAYVDLFVPADKDSTKAITASYTPANISVFIYDPTLNGQEPSYNGTDRMNIQLGNAAERNYFKLIERSKITVSGIEGDYAEYLEENINLFAEKSDKPRLERHWQIYLYHDDLIWSISALSQLEELDDKIRADFDHVVNTFKILD